jgi:hypothetical protein
MKYRMLTKEEMEIFDEDFKHFLITNGVSNEEWLEMNKIQLDQATKLVELFSDTVLQKVYEKMQYLEFRSQESCLVFNCLPDSIELISLNANPNSTVNLSTPDLIHRSLIEHPESIQFFRSEKKYTTLRELEIHKMLEQGCLNSSAEFWKALLSSI